MFPFDHRSRNQSHRLRRNAITLLETIFAVGIAGIGLVGVAILLPMAGKAARDGGVADRAAIIAEDSYREMKTRRFLDPADWLIVSGTASVTSAMTAPVAPSPPGPPFYPPTPTLSGEPDYPVIWNHQKAFCIDPWFIANRITDGVFTTSTLDSRLFPYYSIPAGGTDNNPRLLRVTLPTSPYSGVGMGIQQAGEIFVSSDDLRFALPADKSLLPRQSFFEYTASGTTYQAKRLSDGHLSWFATVIPRHDIYNGTIQGNPQLSSIPAVRTMQYTISIAVVDTRGITMEDASSGNSAGNAECIGQIADAGMLSGTTSAGTPYAMGGGEVFITNIGHSLDSLRAGNWVMLARNHRPAANVTAQPPINSSGTPPTVTIASWYRIISVTDSDVGTGRYATLTGPDWYPDPAFPTQVFIVPRVVAVFDRTVELELSGLW